MEGRAAGLRVAVAVALLAGCGDGRVDVFGLPTRSDAGGADGGDGYDAARDAGDPAPGMYGRGTPAWSPDTTFPLEPAPYEVADETVTGVGSRCYELDPGIDHRKVLKGWRIRDTSPVVRRVIAMRVDLGLAVEHDDDPEPGFPCGKLAGLPRDGLFVASEAEPELAFAPGPAIPLESDDQILVIVGYDTAGTESFPVDVSAGVDLWLWDHEEQEIELATATNELGSVPGGERSVRMEHTLHPDPGRLWGVLGVTNDYATRIELELVRDGSVQPLGRLDPSPEMQGPLLFESLVDVREGDELRVRCTYDTTAVEGSLPWGLPTEGESRELCLGGFYLSRR